MPLGLINGGPFRPLNRAISARCSTTVRSSSATLPNSPTTSSRSWADDRTSRSNGGLTQSLNLTSPRRGKEKVHDRPGFCPCYLRTRPENRLCNRTRHPVPLPRDMMAAVLVQLEGQGEHPG